MHRGHASEPEIGYLEGVLLDNKGIQIEYGTIFHSQKYKMNRKKSASIV
jgi:hypothetical protein